MENTLNIYQRMHAVMKAVAYVQKEEKKNGMQYRFVSHDAVTAKIRPALIDAGIVTVPRVVRRMQDGNRTEADVEVDFVNIDTPDEKITVCMFGFGIDSQDKGPGKAISYAVKYALLKAFSLETGDDPEQDNVEHKPAAKSDPVKAALKAEFPNGESPGKIVEQEAAADGLPVETVAGIRIEAKAIEGDFYTLSAKQALSRWTAFKKDTDEQEQRFCWSLLDSKVRSGIKKIGETVAA